LVLAEGSVLAEDLLRATADLAADVDRLVDHLAGDEAELDDDVAQKARASLGGRGQDDAIRLIEGLRDRRGAPELDAHAGLRFATATAAFATACSACCSASSADPVSP